MAVHMSDRDSLFKEGRKLDILMYIPKTLYLARIVMKAVCSNHFRMMLSVRKLSRSLQM